MNFYVLLINERMKWSISGAPGLSDSCLWKHEIRSWSRLWTEHAGACQKMCCCSIATVSEGGRSFGSGLLVVDSVFSLPCYRASKLSRLRLGQTAAFHLHLGKEELWMTTAKFSLSTDFRTFYHRIQQTLYCHYTLQPPHFIYPSLATSLSPRFLSA